MGNRKNIIIKEYQKEKNVDEMATRASNDGIYTVESLAPGLCYFVDGDTVVIASSTGYMKVHITTARFIASELDGIIDDYEQDKRNGVVPMSTRKIERMLEE